MLYRNARTWNGFLAAAIFLVSTAVLDVLMSAKTQQLMHISDFRRTAQQYSNSIGAIVDIEESLF